MDRKKELDEAIPLSEENLVKVGEALGKQKNK